MTASNAQSTNDLTLAVRLTAAGVGAIAVILIAGRGEVLASIVRMKRIGGVEGLPVGAFARVEVIATEGGVADDALLVRTGETRWELQVHGGTAVVEATLAALAAAGAQVVPLEQAGEWGLLGEPLAGEVLLALPTAVTETALQVMLAQEAAWDTWTKRWQTWLRQANEGNLWQLQSAAQWLLQRSESLMHLLTPARIAIIGAPNAGKSTLANALLGRPVSITSDLAGTTRDWVDAQAIFVTNSEHGEIHAPVILVDTAGVRQTPDFLEQESIARTHHQAAGADVVVILLDATQEVSAEERALLAAYETAVVAVNKTDLAKIPEEFVTGSAIEISAKHHQGLDALMNAVLERLDLHTVGNNEPFTFNPRLHALLNKLALCDDRSTCERLLAAVTRNS